MALLKSHRPRCTPPSLPTRPLLALAAAAVAVLLSGCIGEPIEETLRIEFLREHESDPAPEPLRTARRPGVRMEIEAEVNLNRKAGGKDNEAFQRRMDELAAALTDGNDHWRRRFDRMGSPGADGIDLTRRGGELVRHRKIDELLALPFTVKPADEREIAEALEAALQPLDEYRLSWIRDP